MSTGRSQQAGIGLGIVGDGKGWSGVATRSDGYANRSDKINRYRPQIYFDIAVDGKELGRVHFELLGDIVPKTAENFRQLVVGFEASRVGKGKMTQKNPEAPLGYLNTSFHRIVPGFCIQGGDIDGKGGESIYGPRFPDENFTTKHTKPFMLSMANSGRHTNASQFFITCRKCPHLDGKHVVFGEAIDGYDLLLKMEAYGNRDGKPMFDVKIVGCGEKPKTAATNFRDSMWQRKILEHGEAEWHKRTDVFGNELPSPWCRVESRSKKGVFYYVNKQTQKTSFFVPWTHTGLPEGMDDPNSRLNRLLGHDGSAEGDDSENAILDSDRAVGKRKKDGITIHTSNAVPEWELGGDSGNSKNAASSSGDMFLTFAGEDDDEYFEKEKRRKLMARDEADRACRKGEMKILTFQIRHRDFFGKNAKSWRKPNITTSKKEARAKLDKLLSTFKNQLIGGGEQAMKTKWLNLSTLDNDQDKDKWKLGPIKKGDLNLKYDYGPEVDDKVFALKQGDISEIFEGRDYQMIIARIE